MRVDNPRLRSSIWLVILVLLLARLEWATAQQTAPEGQAAVASELTQAERAWLAGQHTVRARVRNFQPYVIAEPAASGIAVDYLLAVAKRYGFRVGFVQDTIGFPASLRDVEGARQHFDLLLSITRTPEREKQFAITADYLRAPWVVYARRDSPYIIGMESLAGKIVAAETGYVITDRIRSDYPLIRILEVAKPDDALLALVSGQADAYVGNLAVASFLIKASHYDNLVVTAPSPYGINTQAMAVRKDWPELASLIDKGIAALSAEERHAINQKWGSVEYKPQVDYRLVWQIVAASALILLAFFYRNRKLAQEIVRREQAEMSAREIAAQLAAERDRLEQRVVERTAHLSEALEFNETMLLNSPLPMGVYAESGQCVMANEAHATFAGATREALLKQNFNEIPSWKSTSLHGDCLAALRLGTAQQGEAHAVTSFGKEVWVEYRILPRHLKGQVHLLIQFYDLTARKRMEEELRHLAFHDSLTRLPNRRLLLDRLVQALRIGQRENSYLAALFVDLDRFKQLNDSHGHDIGDRMLIEVADRLQAVVRDSDTVARVGGDEFVVLLSGLGTDSERAAQFAQSVVEKMRSALSAEYVFDNFHYQGSASVGVRLVLGGDDDPDQIIKEADAAMYEVKKAK